MPKITLDAALSSKLHEVAQVVELCDPSGRVRGRFIPQVDNVGMGTHLTGRKRRGTKSARAIHRVVHHRRGPGTSGETGMIRVRWARRALDEPTTLWTQANSIQRQAITAASHTLDQRLRGNPFSEGESRSKGRRITFVAPLAFTFRIEPDGQNGFGVAG